MDPHEELRNLAAALQRLIRACHSTAGEVSVALGYHAHQLSHTFRGRRPLRVQLVFDILKVIDVRPFEFFDLVYPYGGSAEVALREAYGVVPLSRSMAEAEQLMRQIEDRRGGPITGPVACAKLGAILRREIADAGLTQREISLTIGKSADALGQALRGGSQLTFLQVFAVLAKVGKTPGRIFAEVLLDAPIDPLEQMRMQQNLDAIAGLHTLLATPPEPAKVPARAAGKGRPAKKPAPGRKRAAKKAAPGKKKVGRGKDRGAGAR